MGDKILIFVGVLKCQQKIYVMTWSYICDDMELPYTKGHTSSFSWIYSSYKGDRKISGVGYSGQNINFCRGAEVSVCFSIGSEGWGDHTISYL